MILRLIVILVFLPFWSFCQNAGTLKDESKRDTQQYIPGAYVILDSIVIQASKNDFDVKDFIEMVRTDHSFYKAFKNLRFASYTFANDIVCFDKKNRIKARYKSLARQNFDGKCRSMETIRIEENKKFYKRNGKPRYYTGKLYEKIFFTKGKICDEKRNESINYQSKPKNKIDKYILELKKLIFNPGEKSDIPFIGNKTEIFSPKMSKYYNFYIKHENYKDSIPAYTFIATAKPGFPPNKTVIKYIKTYFGKKDFQVLAREYHLKYHTLVYDFDVKMKIELNKINGMYYPGKIRYYGNWHILFKKREKCKFETEIFNFRTLGFK